MEGELVGPDRVGRARDDPAEASAGRFAELDLLEEDHVVAVVESGQRGAEAARQRDVVGVHAPDEFGVGGLEQLGEDARDAARARGGIDESQPAVDDAPPGGAGQDPLGGAIGGAVIGDDQLGVGGQGGQRRAHRPGDGALGVVRRQEDGQSRHVSPPGRLRRGRADRGSGA